RALPGRATRRQMEVRGRWLVDRLVEALQALTDLRQQQLVVLQAVLHQPQGRPQQAARLRQAPYLKPRRAVLPGSWPKRYPSPCNTAASFTNRTWCSWQQAA